MDVIRWREAVVAPALASLALLLPAAAHGATATPAGASSTMRPPRAPTLTDADAMARVRPVPEVRPANTRANHTIPTAKQLGTFRRASHRHYTRRVTGSFTGSTDEILQWAAWKWGIDEDVLRAVAMRESGWNQGTVGDRGASFGLMQVKTQLAPPSDGWPGTFPLARDSTPFNVDYYGRAFRSCYDGRETWLGRSYHPGDRWGCVGLWFSGGWYDRPARRYIASVRRVLAERRWPSPRR